MSGSVSGPARGAAFTPTETGPQTEATPQFPQLVIRALFTKPLATIPRCLSAGAWVCFLVWRRQIRSKHSGWHNEIISGSCIVLILGGGGYFESQVAEGMGYLGLLLLGLGNALEDTKNGASHAPALALAMMGFVGFIARSAWSA